jgi:hypothetical protein
MVYLQRLMDQNMMENGSITWSKDQVYKYGKMVKNILECGPKAKKMVTDNYFSKMEAFIRDNSWAIKSMEKEYIIGKIKKPIKGSGKTTGWVEEDF